MLLILFDSDAYSPLQIAAKVEEVGLKKANLGRLPPCVRGFLAGGFIGLEAAFYNGVSNDSKLNFAYKRITARLGKQITARLGSFSARIPLHFSEMIGNLVPATLGNLVRGAGLVGLIYCIVQTRDRD